MNKTTLILTKVLFTGVLMAQTTGYTTKKGISYLSQGTPTFTNNPIEDRGEMSRENLPPKPYGQADFPYSHYNDGSTPQIRAITPDIGVSFGANNLASPDPTKVRTPADNFLAISNNGNILSVDNYAADAYTDVPDTIIQFVNKWQTFFLSSSFSLNRKGFFDPKCIYDKENNRFINVILNNEINDSNSKLLISFSNSVDLNIAEWNHYEVLTDSLYPGLNYWFDYPNIAVNKDELYITLNIFDTNDVFQDNVLFQINKTEGYNGAPLSWEAHQSIQNTSGQKGFALFPLSDAMQDSSYNDGVYLVQTVNSGSGTDSLYWYHLTGNIPDTTKTINSFSLPTETYTYFNYASQPSGLAEHRINVGKCRVRGGYYQNNKLHFVYMRSNSAWGQIVYSKINILTNTEERATYGSGSPNNYCYPSIAHFGETDTTENAMICFLKVGSEDYPSIGVINYDGTWSAETIVKEGDSVLNIVPYNGTSNNYERWGDYTSIQRRYNSSPPTCWLVGSYSFGEGPNLGNVNYGLNGWIAEIRDREAGIVEFKETSKFIIYPNPTQEIITVSIPSNTIANEFRLNIIDELGRVIVTRKLQGNEEQLDISSLSNGVYYVTINSKNTNYGTQKFIKY